jgi:Trk K+ transport system NAD-binding subunit
MDSPVILCGLGRIGWSVLEYLKAAGLPVVAIDPRCKQSDPRLTGVRLIQGDCRQKEILEQAGIAKARGVLVLTSDDLTNISATLMVRSLNPEVRIVVRMFNENLMPRLGKAVTNVYALSVSALTAPILALTALTGTGLGTFKLADGLRQIAEVVVDGGVGPAERSIAQVQDERRCLALAHLPRSGEEWLLRNVNTETRLAEGDRLIVCGQPEDLAPLLVNDGEEFLTNLRWAGFVRRMGRIAARTFADVDRPVLIATIVLILVVVTGTLVYRFGMKDASMAHGLFRTISLLATGDAMHEEELDKEQEWQKVFVSLMRLMGAALIATFTAIVTNYLLRARLGPALEIRRIPDSGHVVVCGLGNIGYGVVEELRNRGEQIVVIEQAADRRFISVARRQGIAVLVGDATVLEVLRQAHAESARAVIAATNNQLANLEIALLARELNPRQRVVLRLADPYLARTLREAANIKLALSTSALAAPAFVAALLGDRVLHLFLVAGKVMLVVELVVQAGDSSVEGQIVGELSKEYQMVPMRLVTADGQGKSRWEDHRLTAGDTLTGILALPDLARLLRRERH